MANSDLYSDGVDSKEAAGCWPGKSAKGQRKQQIVPGASAKTRNSKEGKSSGLAVTPRRQIEQLEMSR